MVIVGFVESGEHHKRDRQIDEGVNGEARKTSTARARPSGPLLLAEETLSSASPKPEQAEETSMMAASITTESAEPRGQLKLWNAVAMRLPNMMP